MKLDNLNINVNDLLDAVKSMANTDVAKVKALLAKRELEAIQEEVEEEKKVKVWVIILAIIGVLAIGCTIGYIVYKRLQPDYLDDFEDEFDEEVEDEDFFED